MTFESIPASLRNPLFYAEVGQPKGAGVPLRTTAIVGQRITGQGTGTNDTVYEVFSADDVAALCGVGSAAHRMAYHYLAEDKTPQQLLVVPIADAGGSAAGTKTLTFTFSSGATLTASGTVNFLIDGQSLKVNVTAGMSLTDIGKAVEDAIGKDEAGAVALGSMLPVTCAATAGAIAFTSRNLGALANDIRILVNYNGPAAGEALPGNLLIDDSDAYLASGSGVPDITAALTALEPYSIHMLVEPQYTTAELLEKKVAFAERWDYSVSTFGHHAAGVTTAALADLLGSGKIEDNLANDWYSLIPACAKVPWSGLVLGAAYAGAVAKSLRNDPSLPVQGVPLMSLYPVRRADWLTGAEIERLTAAGFATVTYDATGTPVISLERTSLLTNSMNAPVTSGEAIQYPATTSYLIEDLRTMVQTELARVKLVDNGSRVAESVAAVTPLEVKGMIFGRIDAWEVAGYIENAQTIKDNLVVERNALNRNRLDVYLLIDLANQLRVCAVRVVPMA